MKKIFLVFLVLISLASCKQKEDRGYVVKIGDKAPDFTVTLSDTSKFTLSENRGKLIMLQFTASWCSVCRKEMPQIETQIWKELQNNPNFILIGIDKDEPLEKIKEFAEQTGITYPLALDPNSKVFELYAEKKAGVTRNVIINKKGEIIFLTRLYDEEEFSQMKKVIFSEIQKN